MTRRLESTVERLTRESQEEEQKALHERIAKALEDISVALEAIVGILDDAKDDGSFNVWIEEPTTRP